MPILLSDSDSWFILNHHHTHTHTHPFNGPFSGTTRVSRYQKGKTDLDFTEARDSEWQWHQLGHMQVCTSLQTDNHANTPPLSFFYRPDALPAAQPTAPPPTAQNYSLRNRPHNRQLPDRISRITDCNFTVRMLYRNMYRLLYILDLCFVLFLCTTAVWQFAINKYVMLC